jgi:hypothetical protein
MDETQLARLVAEVQFSLLTRATHFNEARFSREGTELYDINGELLALRFSVTKDGGVLGYVDVAVNPVLGGPLHALCEDGDWNPSSLLERAKVLIAFLHPGFDLARSRFELYSYPRVGVRFLSNEVGVLVDVLDEEEIFPRPNLTPGPWGNYMSWSVVRRAQAGADRARRNFEGWMLFGRDFLERFPQASEQEWLGGIAFETITEAFPDLKIQDGKFVKLCANSAEEDCFRFHSQKTAKWCVPASMEMMLDFFLAGDPVQETIAFDMGQGTLFHASDLPQQDRGKIVTEILNVAIKSKVTLVGQIEDKEQEVARRPADARAGGAAVRRGGGGWWGDSLGVAVEALTTRRSRKRFRRDVPAYPRTL